MPGDGRFSRRHGFKAPEAEITIREDAPPFVRNAIIMLATRLGESPSNIRLEICEILLTEPNPQNWSDYPNVFNEVQSLMESAPWYKVYDIAEGIYNRIVSKNSASAEEFEDRLNEVFVERGVGWIMKEGRLSARGSEAFAEAARTANTLLAQSGKSTAARELREALQDISRRPSADITGAIQHAIAALECVSRDATGQPSKNLAQLLPQLNLPKPLDSGVEKLWGFASEQARHIREGREPSFEDGELVVTVASAVVVYLMRRLRSSTGAAE